MKSLFLSAALFSVALVSGCSTMDMQETVESGDPKALFEAQISKAEAAFKEVDAQGGGWRDTEETIEAAKKAAESQNYAKAVELVTMAMDEVQLAKAQSDSQKNAKPWQF